MSAWDSFTNLYSLSKTLRFELKPVGKTVDYVDPKTGEIRKITFTEKLLLENQVFEKDKTIDDSYNQAKFYFDTLHQMFINSALLSENTNLLQFDELAKFLEEKSVKIARLRKKVNQARQDKKDTQPIQEKINQLEKEVDDKKKEFYKDIRTLLDNEAEKWKKGYAGKKFKNSKGDEVEIKFGKEGSNEKENQKGVNFLTSAGVLYILKYEFPESKEGEFKNEGLPSLFVEENEDPDKKRYVFDTFDRFSGYLTKFQGTRKNIYADNGIDTALATRIVSNFEIFLANKKVYENKYKQNYQQIGIGRADVFDVNNYKKYLLQSGIEALEKSENSDDSYNKAIGAFNKKIKEYCDQKASEAKEQKNNDSKKPDYPLFKTLKKQILGKIEKEKQLIAATETETEEDIFVQRFKEFIDMNEARFAIAKKFMDKLFSDKEFVSEYEGVFIKNSSLNTIARRWFFQGENFERNLPQVSSKKESDVIKIKKFVTVSDVKNSVEKLEGNFYREEYYKKNIIRKSEQDLWTQFLAIWKFEFENLFKDFKKENGDVVKGYETCLLEARKLRTFSKERKPEEISLVKNYADASLRIFQMIKYLALDERDTDKLSGISTDFYAELDDYAKDFEFSKYYNSFRNFITKKQFDENKIKLNFEKGNLLGGWAESPKGNAQFCAYVLKKNADYFLAITKYTHFLDTCKYDLTPKNKEDVYEKVEYSSLNWGKNITGGQVYASYTKEKFGKSISYQEHKKQLKSDEHISFIKQLIGAKYISKFPELQGFINKDFKDVVEMQKSFSELQLGGIQFEKVKANWIDEQIIKEKKKKHQLYLFQILNRDLRSQNSSSSKNIHTLYWDALFSNTNLNAQIFDLLGNAEIFYRKASEGLKVRKNKNGEEYINKKGEKIIEGRRYSRDIIQLHIPISLNYSKKSMKKGQFNKEINKYISGHKEINVIGLDRGEKHLVYYSVVNQKGEIIDQGSLNEINDINYYEKLVSREKERLENRQSWNTIGKIKDLKKGYVSQVVRKISDLVDKHDAIVVMEDLNMRFKQIRGGIDRSVYQQLEKQLIDKFGYLVFKDRGSTEKGGVLNGYQLSAPFDTFEKMGKQTGIVFYTQAGYTSVTDPLTGFRKNIYISNSASQRTIAEAVTKLGSIKWDDKTGSYYFTFNPVNFFDEKSKKNVFFKDWTVYAKVPRIRREKDEKGYWQYQPVDVNKKFKELFKLWGFENVEGDIRKQIQAMESSGSLRGEKEFDGKLHSFYHAFIYLFNLILQLRNSYSEQWITEEQDGKTVAKRTGENIDFIASPVKPFFSTFAVNQNWKELSPKNFVDFEKRIISEEKEKIIKEFNGDANGAYNIARKGVMLLNKIKEHSRNDPEFKKYLDLFISDQEWDNAVSDWDNYLAKNV